jgi:hypothetical protein
MSNYTRCLVTAGTAIALGAPVAHARPAIDPPVHNTTPPVAAPAASAPSSADGFDWGSAAVGAGGVAGLVVLLSAGAAVASRARVPSTR